MNVQNQKTEGERKDPIKGGVQDPSKQTVLKSVGGWGLHPPTNLIARVRDRMIGKHTEVSTSTQPAVDPSGEMMHALTWEGANTIGYTVTPKPAIVEPTDVLLKVTATTICGSDLHIYTGELFNVTKGEILGHEFMGVIEDVGKDVKNLQRGQRVVVAFGIADGTCEYCQREEYTGCSTTNDSLMMERMFGHKLTGIFGYSHLLGAYPGGQSEYVRVPYADVNCLPLPDDVPDEKALYLSDIIPTSYHGTELANVQAGDTVGVWGLGPVGLLAARWCQVRGAARVIGIDCVKERLALAQRVLGIEVVDCTKGDTLEQLHKMVPRGLDAGIECAGFRYATSFVHKVERALGMETDAGDILTECIMAIRPFGRLALIGDYVGTVNHFPIGPLMEKSINLRGGQSPTQKYWKYCLKMIQSGEFDPSFIVTHKLRLQDAPEAYEQFNKKEGGMIKVFIRP